MRTIRLRVWFFQFAPDLSRFLPEINPRSVGPRIVVQSPTFFRSRSFCTPDSFLFSKVVGDFGIRIVSQSVVLFRSFHGARGHESRIEQRNRSLVALRVLCMGEHKRSLQLILHHFWFRLVGLIAAKHILAEGIDCDSIALLLLFFPFSRFSSSLAGLNVPSSHVGVSGFRKILSRSLLTAAARGSSTQ